MIRALSQSRSRTRPLLILLALAIFIYLFLPSPASQFSLNGSHPAKDYPLPSREIVVAAVKHDSVAWIEKYLPEWRPRIYIANAADYGDKRSLTVPRNKGREANVYLTYIIDNYHNLPDYMVFIHSLRYQWHNEDPMYDGVPPIRNLRLSYLEKAGFLPLRCSWTLGCPAELKPTNPYAHRVDDRFHTEEAYAEAFVVLFPNMTVPSVVGSPCGGQFALTRDKVHERPLSDYRRYRDWLMETELTDNISGRILEYSWHIIFGKEYVNCPPAQECFCNVFGLCNLKCPTKGECEKRYHLPQVATIPKGWPEVGPGRDGWPVAGWAD
ncbi:hypothetical protein TWF694_002255 [Orbilia ellipsospora]|uniref:Uncharacterized protein n=1 Tax=Orbilia ellipsospora TaxID=2528407 RepID=A0AAV9X1M4_9PEZI